MERGLLGLVISGLLFAAMPASSSYGLHNYSFGSGGTSGSSSTNYSVNGITGGTSNVQSASTTYQAKSGNNNSLQSNVPPAPTFTNPSSYYNKLKFIINTGSNPSDTKFSIAISSDNFASTQYVKSDDTVGSTKAITDYQTYAAWGGSSGQLVTGLNPNTTYQMKVNAFQGKYTETQYGPAASAATVPPSIRFDIDVSPTDSETTPPFSTTFGNLLPATVTNTTDKIWVDLDTNANSGASVYISSANGGLHSNSVSSTIASASADLSSAGTGFGAQGSTATQTSGGPLSITAPYNVSANNVGILNSTVRGIFASTAPITGGRGSFTLMAKAAALTPAAPDYKDTLTLTAAASY